MSVSHHRAADLNPGQLECIVDRVAEGRFFYKYIDFPLAIIIASVLHSSLIQGW
jgi:hypothetical protein